MLTFTEIHQQVQHHPALLFNWRITDPKLIGASASCPHKTQDTGLWRSQTGRPPPLHSETQYFQWLAMSSGSLLLRQTQPAAPEISCKFYWKLKVDRSVTNVRLANRNKATSHQQAEKANRKLIWTDWIQFCIFTETTGKQNCIY